VFFFEQRTFSAGVILPVPETNVPQPKEVRDLTVDRLRELRARLQERLAEAEDLRVKLTEARNANRWPDMKTASRLLIDYNDRRRAG
jgi:hypothetical protein